MSGRYTIPAGVVVGDDDESWGLVIDPEWTDAQIADAWNAAPDWRGPAVEIQSFERRTLYAHSARQLRDDPKPFDEWWSDEGELRSSIVVAELEGGRQ